MIDPILMRVKVNFRKGLQIPHQDCQEEVLKEELEKFFMMKTGDFVEIGAKRLCYGIFLGIEDRKTSHWSDETDPHLILADSFCEGRAVQVPLWDIFFFRIISRFKG